MSLLAHGRLPRVWRPRELASSVLVLPFTQARASWYRASSELEVSRFQKRARRFERPHFPGGSDGPSAPHRKPVRRVYVHHPARWRACRMASSPCSRCVLPAGSLPRSPPARSFSTPDRSCAFRADLTDRPSSHAQDGHKHMSGLDEAVIKNVEACKQLSKITRTSLGPNGASTLPRTQIWRPKTNRHRASRSTFALPGFFAKRKVVIVANVARRAQSLTANPPPSVVHHPLLL